MSGMSNNERLQAIRESLELSKKDANASAAQLSVFTTGKEALYLRKTAGNKSHAPEWRAKDNARRAELAAEIAALPALVHESLGAKAHVAIRTRQASLLVELNELCKGKDADQAAMDAALGVLNEGRKAKNLPVVGWQFYRESVIGHIGGCAEWDFAYRSWVDTVYNVENRKRLPAKDGAKVVVVVSEEEITDF